MSLATEAVLIIPVIVMVLTAMVAGWRIWSVRTDVRHASQASARAASLQASGTIARQRALEVAGSQLRGVPCRSSRVDVDTTGFARLGDASVRVHIACTVGLDDLLLPGMPGTVDASATGSSVLDRFRERRP
ncbi:TadE/TadG family type IV pilus assembly protein [Aestuariimicrobium soli]|uniref:TadE/TadG family type IV pilus assembly protein n=1 Tax=Aestuariimicrobium soli TaxID=2035834 RepID=UPI003EBA299D